MEREIYGSHEAEILDKIHEIILQHKREVGGHYGEIKIRLPRYLQSITVSQLREAGGTVDPDITIPRAVKEHFRQKADISVKLDEIRSSCLDQIAQYYTNIKRQLPEDLLQKKMSELTKEEWALLGIDKARLGLQAQ